MGMVRPATAKQEPWSKSAAMCHGNHFHPDDPEPESAGGPAMLGDQSWLVNRDTTIPSCLVLRTAEQVAPASGTLMATGWRCRPPSRSRVTAPNRAGDRHSTAGHFGNPSGETSEPREDHRNRLCGRIVHGRTLCPPCQDPCRREQPIRSPIHQSCSAWCPPPK